MRVSTEARHDLSRTEKSDGRNGCWVSLPGWTLESIRAKGLAERMDDDWDVVAELAADLHLSLVDFTPPCGS